MTGSRKKQCSPARGRDTRQQNDPPDRNKDRSLKRLRHSVMDNRVPPNCMGSSSRWHEQLDRKDGDEHGGEPRRGGEQGQMGWENCSWCHSRW